MKLTRQRCAFLEPPPVEQAGGKAELLPFAALGGALLVGVQLCLIIWRGEAACFNEGCRVVEALTRVSPLVFNLFGMLFFLAVALLSVLHRRRPALAALTALLLLAAMAGEGVLLAYQHHVARAWCSYCLVVFGLVALCNLLLGWRQLGTGLVLVAAVNLIFALLRFEPVPTAQGSSLAAGTAAVRSGPANARSVSLIYANDCPHCMALLRRLPEFAACTIRLNPVGDPPPGDIADLTRTDGYQPAINRQLLRLLGIDAVPVLFVPENGGYQVLRSQTGIESFLQSHCRGPATAPPVVSAPGRTEVSAGADQPSLLPPTGEQECGVEVKCDDPAASFLGRPAESSQR